MPILLFYERAKEELRAGKTLEEAVKTSYSWRGAMSSITDANVTHILTGAVVYIWFRTIKGLRLHY
jgi:SecD/SecF fusion protein